jgi:hypothetical protein
VELKHIGYAECPGEAGDLQLAQRAAMARQVDMDDVEPAGGLHRDHAGEEGDEVERKKGHMTRTAAGGEAHVEAGIVASRQLPFERRHDAVDAALADRPARGGDQYAKRPG